MGNSIYRYDTLYRNNVFVVNVGDVITVKLGAQNQIKSAKSDQNQK